MSMHLDLLMQNEANFEPEAEGGVERRRRIGKGRLEGTKSRWLLGC
jgi:hypothetical protein